MPRTNPAKKFAIYDVEITGKMLLPTTRFRNVNRPAPSSEDAIEIEITWGVPYTNFGVRATPDNTDHDDCPDTGRPKENDVKNIQHCNNTRLVKPVYERYKCTAEIYLKLRGSCA